VAKTGSFRLDFSISQTIRERLVLKAIQKFLLELLLLIFIRIKTAAGSPERQISDA
jgi:hypothetical protein